MLCWFFAMPLALAANALIDGVVADNATRTSAADIEAHLESLMPSF